MNDQMPLRCEEKDGAIDMGVSRDVLCFVAKYHPYFYDPDARPEGPNIKITDARAFAHEVVQEINRESETGDTLLITMLDEAIKRAIENGCEGVDHDA